MLKSGDPFFDLFINKTSFYLSYDYYIKFVVFLSRNLLEKIIYSRWNSNLLDSSSSSGSKLRSSVKEAGRKSDESIQDISEHYLNTTK